MILFFSSKIATIGYLILLAGIVLLYFSISLSTSESIGFQYNENIYPLTQNIREFVWPDEYFVTVELEISPDDRLIKLLIIDKNHMEIKSELISNEFKYSFKIIPEEKYEIILENINSEIVTVKGDVSTNSEKSFGEDYYTRNQIGAFIAIIGFFVFIAGLIKTATKNHWIIVATSLAVVKWIILPMIPIVITVLAFFGVMIDQEIYLTKYDECFGEKITIKGTIEPDYIIGTNGRDVIGGGFGGDIIDGLGGDDLICGSNGDDYIIGGDGDDLIHGSFGNDVLNGGNGDDVLRGSPGNDRLDGGDGDDILNGGDGDDQCVGEELVNCEPKQL